MKRFLSLLIAGTFLIALLGCETFKGIGKDIENTGKNLQEVFNKDKT